MGSLAVVRIQLTSDPRLGLYSPLNRWNMALGKLIIIRSPHTPYLLKRDYMDGLGLLPSKESLTDRKRDNDKGLYKHPVPFCFTRKVVIVSFSSDRFPSFGPYRFRYGHFAPCRFPTKTPRFALRGARKNNPLARGADTKSPVRPW